MQLTDRQNALLEFVKQQHGEQLRKYTNEPYWTHPLAVAEIVSKVTDRIYDYYKSHNALALVYIEVALCHDLLEDTKCGQFDLFNFLVNNGYYPVEANTIVSGTIHLTDIYTKEKFPDWNREKRKYHEAKRLGIIPGWMQTVKLADLIHNTSSIVSHDAGFAVKYIQEKKQILDCMRAGNIDLHIACCHSVYVAEQTINSPDYKLLVKLNNEKII